MKLFISLSAKQVGDLYHGTRKGALLNILRTGKLQLTLAFSVPIEEKLQRGKAYFSSLTRSRFGAYHFKNPDKKSLREDTDVMITFDGTALSNHFKIVPVDYWGSRGQDGSDNEIEERLISNQPEVQVLRYIKRVDFIQPAIAGEIETYGFDKGKFKLVENDRVSKLLGSVILQLKRRNIPYAFYHNMRDWAMRRNEYTYIGKKEVESTKSKSNQSSYLLRYSIPELSTLAEVLSDSPYEDLSDKAKDLADKLRRYPHDAISVLNEIGSNRKPDAHYYARKLSAKIARIAQRKGLKTADEVAKYIIDKADTYYKQKELKAKEERAKKAAAEILTMLIDDRENWNRHPGLGDWDSPMLNLSEMEERFSYRASTVEGIVKDTLEQVDVDEVVELKQAMHALRLEDAYDVVSYIFNQKISTKPIPQTVNDM